MIHGHSNSFLVCHPCCAPQNIVSSSSIREDNTRVKLEAVPPSSFVTPCFVFIECRLCTSRLDSSI